jgi:hypothetical protein
MGILMTAIVSGEGYYITSKETIINDCKSTHPVEPKIISPVSYFTRYGAYGHLPIESAFLLIKT